MISLDRELKAWLDRRALQQKQTMTAVVRDALAAYREAEAQRDKPTRDELLARTRGIWLHGDGLEWQDSLRGEWSGR